MNIRSANQIDLDAINKIIHAAVMSWKLPERVKQLSVTSHYYNEIDLKYLDIIVAEENNMILAVAALENEINISLPECDAILLHGIYVLPEHQGTGLGRKLFHEIETMAHARQADAIVVKAQKDAEGFFRAMHLEKLDTIDSNRDYENRYWKKLFH